MIDLFGRQLPVIISPSESYICSSHPRLVKKYIEKLHKYFIDYNIVQKAKDAKYYNPDKVEKLDELIIAGMLHAKKKYLNSLRMTWSKEINEVMTQFHVLKISPSSLRNKKTAANKSPRNKNSFKR